jgi:polyferredoxin
LLLGSFCSTSFRRRSFCCWICFWNRITSMTQR